MMYETFFGLNRRAFGAAPDSGCVASVETMQQALHELTRCVENGGEIGVLTATPGLGKTLLCRKLIEDLQGTFETVFLPNSNLATRRSLLQAILYELRQPYTRMAEQELRLEFTTAVRQVRPNREAVLLVIDEAHLLNERLLEEIRTCTNLVEDGVPLVRVVLSGQPELEERLLAPALDAFNQRIRAQVMLEPLTRRESADYITQRLQWAGAQADRVFTSEALELICHCADGVPRCLNQLCDHSLCLAAAGEIYRVDAFTVQTALEELKRLPLHWNEPSSASFSTSHGDQARNAEVEIGPTHIDSHQVSEADVDSADNLEPAGSIEVGAALPETANPALVDSHPGETASPADSDAETPQFDSHAIFELADSSEGSEQSEEQVHQLDPVKHDSVLEFVSEDSTLSEPITGESPAVEQSAEITFEEELVVDRYAMLDAGHGKFSEIAGGHGTAEPPAAAQWDSTSDSESGESIEPDLSPDVSHTADQGSLEEDELLAWQEARPDQTLDEIVPLLDAALETSDVVQPSDVEADSALGYREIDGPEILDPQTESVVFYEEPHSESFEVHALDLATEHTEEVEHGTFQQKVEFDIVLPEESESYPEAADAPAPDAEAPAARQPPQPRHYRRLFSELRRRQRQDR